MLNNAMLLCKHMFGKEWIYQNTVLQMYLILLKRNINCVWKIHSLLWPKKFENIRMYFNRGYKMSFYLRLFLDCLTGRRICEIGPAY